MITFLFTDIEGSTQLWERHEVQMDEALQRHDQILRATFSGSRGRVFATAGDGFGVAFDQVDDALMAALEAQRRLAEEAWPAGAAVSVRMGLHTGEAHERDGDFFGSSVNRAARLMSAGHGGQVLLSDSTARLVDRPDLVDLGEHRLKDLTGAERVWQVGTRTFPPLRTPVARSNAKRVPAPLTTLIGRESEVGSVTAAVLSSTRLITIVGAGGVGKTRVALEALRQLVAEFGGGIWWAELAPVRDRADVHFVVASALELRPLPGSDIAASIVDGIGDERLLLALDNCEHVLDHCFELVDGILARCPNCVVVATSREPLGAAGEVLIRVQPLPSRAEDGTMPGPAVELFYERAGEAGADVIDDESVVTEICRHLDGLPLAIELAAGLTPSLGTVEIHEGLAERFELLTGPRGVMDRQRTLRNTVMWSYDLLGNRSRDLLLWLAVFAGSFSLDDVQRLTELGPGPSVSGMRDLVDKSLVVADRVGRHTRYVLLETVREFAVEQLDSSGAGSERRARHAVAFARLATELGEQSRGPNEAEAVRRAFEALDNFREAHRWAGLNGDFDVALVLVTELFDIAKWAGMNEVVGWAESMTSVRAARTTARGATAVAITGEAALMRGALDDAEQLAWTALAMDPPPHRPSLAHFVLEGAALFRGDWTLVAKRAEAMELAARRRGFEADEIFGWMHHVLATTHGSSERLSAVEEVVRRAREFGNSACLSHAYMYLGLALREVGDAAAGTFFRESAELAGRCGYRLIELRSLLNACYTDAISADEPSEDLATVVELLDRWRGKEEAVDVVTNLGCVALVLSNLGRWEPFALLIGFADSTVGMRCSQDVMDRIETQLRAAERACGASTVAAARATGARMTLEGALALARSAVNEPSPGPGSSHSSIDERPVAPAGIAS